MQKTRLDQLLVARGLCESRTLAQRFVQAGQVFVDGQLVDKPAAKFSEDAPIEVRALPRYVSRGGEKLEGALAAFGVDLSHKVCLDLGASTGGFTDCLLQRGAARVYAVDVGRHQLHPRLRGDARVVVLEALNARALAAAHVPEPVTLCTADVSFISVQKVLPPTLDLVAPDGAWVVLVKPQFEAGRGRVGRGGVVRDARVHLEVLQATAVFVRETLGLVLAGATHSPIKGPAGNMEFFFHLRRGAGGSPPDLEAVVAAAHRALG